MSIDRFHLKPRHITLKILPLHLPHLTARSRKVKDQTFELWPRACRWGQVWPWHVTMMSLNSNMAINRNTFCTFRYSLFCSKSDWLYQVLSRIPNNVKSLLLSVKGTRYKSRFGGFKTDIPHDCILGISVSIPTKAFCPPMCTLQTKVAIDTLHPKFLNGNYEKRPHWRRGSFISIL